MHLDGFYFIDYRGSSSVMRALVLWVCTNCVVILVIWLERNVRIFENKFEDGIMG